MRIRCNYCAVCTVNGHVVHEAGCPSQGNPNDSRTTAFKSSEAMRSYYRAIGVNPDRPREPRIDD